MRVTRKIQSLAEAKIRHAIATGPLPFIVRTTTTQSHPKQDSNKTGLSDTSRAKEV